MTEKNNAKCSICGKDYYMCRSCKDIRNLYPWKLHTDTSEHYKIYQILHGFSTGVYNKVEAKEKLQTVDLSDIDSLRDNIKSLINEIMDCDDDTKDKEFLFSDFSEQSDVIDNVSKPKTVRKKKSVKVVETED